jgi:hypothetical protein
LGEYFVINKNFTQHSVANIGQLIAERPGMILLFPRIQSKHVLAKFATWYVTTIQIHGAMLPRLQNYTPFTKLLFMEIDSFTKTLGKFTYINNNKCSTV